MAPILRDYPHQPASGYYKAVLVHREHDGVGLPVFSHAFKMDPRKAPLHDRDPQNSNSPARTIPATAPYIETVEAEGLRSDFRPQRRIPGTTSTDDSI